MYGVLLQEVPWSGTAATMIYTISVQRGSHKWFHKSSLHKHTYINGSFCQYKFNLTKNLNNSVTLKSFIWLWQCGCTGTNLLYLNTPKLQVLVKRDCVYPKNISFFFSVPCWSISTLRRKDCSWEPQTSSVCMAHLLTEISATGVTVSETQICLLGIELRPQTHFPQGKQTVSDSNQVV